MGTVAVIGEEVAVRGYALAGALVVPADDEAAVRTAWASLDPGVDVVVLTARAAAVLGPARETALRPLTVVMPS